ncbi:MAG: hypothetical protein QF441_01480 [Bacteriovoracaceae bacterium]|jgi:YbbR domain-containing protein|nr:hypothetical protein [Halobacteriovoraceae bacterium]MDP7319243.1 hypothetical protein [Bacteriovoracaceae bacterium]
MKRAILRKNIWLKAFSVFASIFIWMYVVSSAEIEVNKSIPIAIELPQELAMKNEIINQVNYRLKGPGIFVRKFVDKNLKIRIKKESYFKRGVQKYSIALDSYKFKLPLGVELLNIEPRYITLDLEKKISKKVRVVPSFSNEILSLYNIKDLKVTPKKIKVSGARSLVNRLQLIETKTINEIQNTAQGNLVVGLHKNDPRLSFFTESVNVSYHIQSKTISKSFSEIPIIFQSMELIKQTSHKFVTITLEGDEKLINELAQDSIQVIANIPKGSPKKLKLELITDLPEGIKVSEINPKLIDIVLE